MDKLLKSKMEKIILEFIENKSHAYCKKQQYEKQVVHNNYR